MVRVQLVLAFSIALSTFGLVLALFQIHLLNSDSGLPVSDDFTSLNSPYQWDAVPHPPNPDPPRLASTKNIPTSQQVYIAVIDTAYSAERYHCIMKRQWIDSVSQFDYIDGIEFYSVVPFQNPDCDFAPLTVPPFRYDVPNPSSHLLFHTLRMFLERSSAEFLFVINDAAYVDIDKFDRFLRESYASVSTMRSWAAGGCIERRFYFQMLTVTSGILLTRNTIQHVVERESMWNVTIETGLPSEESFSQILDDASVTPKWSRRDEFLGQPFRKQIFGEKLMTKDFGHLKQCVTPNDNPGDSGIATVCSTSIVPLKSLIVWAGGGKRPEDKERFLLNAKEMLEGNPDNLHFTWDRLYPELCTNG
jgi:hypothetical protein